MTRLSDPGTPAVHVPFPLPVAFPDLGHEPEAVFDPPPPRASAPVTPAFAPAPAEAPVATTTSGDAIAVIADPLDLPPRSGGRPARSVLASLAEPLALAVVAPALGAVFAVALVAADSALAWLGLAAALAGLAIGGTGAWGVARRVLREVDQPVDDLRVALERLVAGDGRARVATAASSPLRPIMERFDELADLTEQRMTVLRRKAEWGDQSRMIFEALELAEDEAEAFLVVEDALDLLEAGCRVELLMAPRGHLRLRSMASNPSAPAPECPVETTAGCVAIRRGQVVTAESSESINSCPRLRERPEGPCSATCVPVTVAGHPMGVLHSVGPDGTAADPLFVDRLSTVAAQVGNRIAALRALETSREEAATDGLTGLPNRRVLDGQLTQLLDSAVPFVMVLADLDSFKMLNDTYGHEAGDRALQLFSRVLQENIRDHDLVARVGGEEFVVVYPEMSVLRSIEAIERIRQALDKSIAKASGHRFTCSFGVTHSSVGVTLNEVLRVADAGLLRAKALGGDQVVYADEGLAAEVFGEHGRTARRGLHPD